MTDASSLFERRKRVYKMLRCLVEVDNEPDPGGFDGFDPAGLDDEAIRREWRSHVQCLREYEGHMHCALRAMEGVLEWYGADLQRKRVLAVWYEDFRGAYEVFLVEAGSITDKRQYVVMNNHQLLESVRQFACWVQLDVNALRAKYERIPDELLPEIALAVAVDNKTHWHSTQYRVYAKSLALALALEHKEHWYSTQARVYARSRQDSI